MRLFRSTFVMLVTLTIGSAAWAGGTAVKCGRVYQDRPCANPGKLIAATKSQKGVGVSRTVDAACQRRGADAQKLIEARAQGATEQDQLQTMSHSVSQMKLVSEVYKLDGTPAEQRAKIEAACMAERQQIAASRPRR